MYLPKHGVNKPLHSCMFKLQKNFCKEILIHCAPQHSRSNFWLLEADFKILVVRHTYSLLHIRDCMDSMDTWDPQKFSGVLRWSWNHQGIWETSRALQILRWTWAPQGVLKRFQAGCGNPHWDSFWPIRTFRCH